MGRGPRQTPTKCMKINYESGAVGALFIHLKIIDETYTACNALCCSGSSGYMHKYQYLYSYKHRTTHELNPLLTHSQ